MSIQLSSMQCLLWIGWLVSENFLGSYVKTMSADGDHLEFPIGTKKKKNKKKTKQNKKKQNKKTKKQKKTTTFVEVTGFREFF